MFPYRLLSLMVFAVAMVDVRIVAAGEEVRLLTGFEKEQMLEWGAKEKLGASVIAEGDTTQGKWALCRGFDDVKSLAGPYEKGKFRYLETGEGYRPLVAWVFNTHLYNRNWFNKPFGEMFPTDWSAYDRLRLDAKSTKSAAHLRLILEDGLITPFLHRVYKVPAGEWVTLEFDLAEAGREREVALSPAEAKRIGKEKVKARLLDLSRMANAGVLLEQADTPTAILLDNLRLIARGAKAEEKLSVVRDESPFPVPEGLPPGRLQPRDLPDEGKMNRKPLEMQPPVRIDFGRAKKGGYARLALVRRALAAVDNDRMVLAFQGAGYINVLKTTDGGKTWTGLKGEAQGTSCEHSFHAPAVVAASAGPDILILHATRCNGGSTPHDMAFRHVKFNSESWELRPPGLVDIDCRHCPEFKVDVIRLGDGRFWGVWAHHDRFDRVNFRARFSDDEGQTWRDPDSNGMIEVTRPDGKHAVPVTWWKEPFGVAELTNANGKVCDPCGARPMLTPYGDHVALFFVVAGDGTWWSYFDGASWSKAQRACKELATSVVTEGAKTVYLAAGDKILRLEGEKWLEDSPWEVPKSDRDALLSVSGNILTCSWLEKEGEDMVRVLVAQKPGGDKWRKPQEVAQETTSLTLMAPQYSPPNFVPLAWGPGGHAKYFWSKTPEKSGDWVKVLRVPVTP
ncbi:MAG: sialidase family protein [Planctomycetota bacterium]